MQPEIMLRSAQPTAAFETTLLQLAGAIGALVASHEGGTLQPNQTKLAKQLSNILRLLVVAANEAGVTLEAAAVKNLAKINDRWPVEREFPKPFDVRLRSE